MKTLKYISAIFVSLLCLTLGTSEAYAQMEIEVSVRTAPPPLPVYVQPPCPVDGFLWVPGYWAYNGDDYYWVPGVWVRPPRYGYFWTPCWWGFSNGYYGYHPGYWGLHIGYYGGVNYGYGYTGIGYCGGRWGGGYFRYNTAVVNVNTTVVRNTYVDRTVIVNNNTTVNRSSYNGPGGITARPTREEERYTRERHDPATTEQVNHQQVSSRDKNQFASVNKGRPSAIAMNKVGGQSFNPQGHRATARTEAAHNQQMKRANEPNNNVNAKQPSLERGVNPPAGSNRRESNNMNLNNNRAAQPSQHQANMTNRQPHPNVNRTNNNNHEKPQEHHSKEKER